MVKVPNWINGQESETADWIQKFNPATEEVLWQIAKSTASDVSNAVSAAQKAQASWAAIPPVARGDMLHKIANAMESAKAEIAEIVHIETGKSMKDALGEVDGSVKLARFFAGEGQRFFGRTTTSGTPNRTAHIIRQPIGVVGLIAAANTPIANISWKIFPALICGNTAVFKSSEDTPRTSWIVGRIAKECGLPDGVLNIIQGLGAEAGQALVEDERVGAVSFTGSTAVGIKIGEICAKRLAKCSLELGGKNPFVVCDDANLDKAVHWAILSAFSNAGQRCASASRIIVEKGIYNDFKNAFVARTKSLQVGTADSDDLGPVINVRQLNSMSKSVSDAVDQGAKLLAGGQRDRETGFFMQPTVLEGVEIQAEISQRELFGPITILYKAENYAHALELANSSDYGLTACIHTQNINQAWHFVHNVRAGVASINAATFGSEPHMPFGGVGLSGNGSREPGPEAIDFYTNLKNILVQMEPDLL